MAMSNNTAETAGPRIIKGKYQKSHKHRLPRKAKKLRKKGRFDAAAKSQA